MSQYYKLKNYAPLSSDDMELCAKTIYEHIEEFENYIKDNFKLQAVKSLKEYTSLGLRNSKLFIDEYFCGNITILTIKEDRRKKLERLAKNPLIEEIIKNLRNANDEKLNSLLMSFSIDELFSIDEKLNDN